MRYGIRNGSLKAGWEEALRVAGDLLRQRFVVDGEALEQHFKRAPIAMVRKLRVHHIEVNYFSTGRRGHRKSEFRFWVDELGNQPCRADPIDFRPWSCRPRLAPVVLGIETG